MFLLSYLFFQSNSLCRTTNKVVQTSIFDLIAKKQTDTIFPFVHVRLDVQITSGC